MASETGGSVAAAVALPQSLLETSHLLDINLYDYLVDVLDRLVGEQYLHVMVQNRRPLWFKPATYNGANPPPIMLHSAILVHQRPRPSMRYLLVAGFCLVSTYARADMATDFLDIMCANATAKQTAMSKAEIQRYCNCVRDDVSPRLSSVQRSILAAAQSDLTQGRQPNADRVASSRVRDFVIAAQARCEAAFYPPSTPISIASGDLQLTLRCEPETHAPEVILYVGNGALLSKAELDATVRSMASGQLSDEFAQVSQIIDGSPRRIERWKIDLTGQIVSSPHAAAVVAELRTAGAYEVVIRRAKHIYAGRFLLTGRIPARWVPCGGIVR